MKSSILPNTLYGSTTLTTRTGSHAAKKVGAVPRRTVKGAKSGKDFSAINADINMIDNNSSSNCYSVLTTKTETGKTL